MSTSWRWVWSAYACLAVIGALITAQTFIADLGTAGRKATSDTISQARTAAEQLRWVVGGSKIVLRSVVRLIENEGGWAAALAKDDERAEIKQLVADLPY